MFRRRAPRPWPPRPTNPNAHGAAAHGALDGRGRAQGRDRGSAREDPEEVASPELFLFGGEAHQVLSTAASVERCRGRPLPQQVEAGDPLGAEDEQHQDRRGLDEVLAHEQVGPFRTGLVDARGRDLGQIEEDEEKQGAPGADSGEEAEGQGKTDDKKGDRNEGVEDAKGARVGQSLEEPGERTARGPQIARRAPSRERDSVTAPGGKPELDEALVEEVPPDEGAQQHQAPLLGPVERGRVEGHWSRLSSSRVAYRAASAADNPGAERPSHEEKTARPRVTRSWLPT